MRLSVPKTIQLPAIDEVWNVERVDSHSGTFPLAGNSERAYYSMSDRIVRIPGKFVPTKAFEVLRVWLRLRAKEALPPMLIELSLGLGVPKPIARIFVKDLKSRWGSCSSRNNINLNSKLLFLPPDLVRHVMLHELCHLFEMNHSAAFYTRLREADPEADRHIGEMRVAAERVPAWAKRPRRVYAAK